MNILHVLNAADGGATSSAIGLVKASRREESGVNHFAVYPGIDSTQAITSAFHDSASIPMRWWAKNVRAGYLRRPIRWMLDVRRTRFDSLPRQELLRCIDKWKIDIVHTNTALNRDGAIVAKKLGIPHIWHIRESIGKAGTQQFYESNRSLAHYIADHSKYIVPVSNYTAKIFYDNDLAKKTIVVNNAIDVEEYRSEYNRLSGIELRKLLRIEPGESLVAMVAPFGSMVKRHDLFLNMAAELIKTKNNVKIAIFGAVPKAGTWLWRNSYDYYLGLVKQMSYLGLSDKILMPGHYPSTSIMNAINLLVHPCPQEGFGRIAIEAMAAGRPVVGPLEGGISEIVKDGETGYLVDMNNSNLAAEKIHSILADSSLYTKFSNAGLSKTNKLYSDKKLLQIMLEIYQNSTSSGLSAIAQ